MAPGTAACVLAVGLSFCFGSRCLSADVPLQLLQHDSSKHITGRQLKEDFTQAYVCPVSHFSDGPELKERFARKSCMPPAKIAALEEQMIRAKDNQQATPSAESIALSIRCDRLAIGQMLARLPNSFWNEIEHCNEVTLSTSPGPGGMALHKIWLLAARCYIVLQTAEYDPTSPSSYLAHLRRPQLSSIRSSIKSFDLPTPMKIIRVDITVSFPEPEFEYPPETTRHSQSKGVAAWLTAYDADGKFLFYDRYWWLTDPMPPWQTDGGV
jgi:hypothetical protein